MNKPIRAVIFDIDGVITDSRVANRTFLTRVLVKGGYKKPTDQALDGCFHLTLWDSLIHLTGTKDMHELDRLFNIAKSGDIYPRDMMSYPESLVPVLSQLAGHYRLGIATGRIRQGIDSIFDRTGIGRFFTASVGAEDYIYPKPSPESLLIAAKKLDIPADESVYVGDSDTDIEAAHAAGMRSIHLSSRAHAHANIRISDFGEIPAALSKIG